MLTREDVLPYVNRDWARVRRAKLEWWASLTPAQRLTLGDELSQWAERVAGPPDRAADLAHHIVLARRMRAAG